uniref:Putative secreted protein n=1 Tax=Ixodes ricinus TaxID=34613 RepID=A0A6B0U3J9_IXORI
MFRVVTLCFVALFISNSFLLKKLAVFRPLIGRASSKYCNWVSECAEELNTFCVIIKLYVPHKHVYVCNRLIRW